MPKELLPCKFYSPKQQLLNFLQHWCNRAENILHHAHPDISVQTKFQFYRIAVLHCLRKVIFNVLHNFILINPYAIFKMKIQTSIIQIDRSHHANLIITYKRFRVEKSRLIFIDFYSCFQQLSVIRRCQKKYQLLLLWNV